jgi:hypothetical protein
LRTTASFFYSSDAGDQKKITLVMAVVIKLALIVVAYFLPDKILDLLGIPALDHATLINYAPEVWISLLALVFGTLIIVVSIASENTPRLIDLFIGEPKGRLYIWLIMFSCLENIYLQLFSTEASMFMSNMIFINSYVLLPSFVLLAIPYTFYILENTKTSKVIERIHNENVRVILSPPSPGEEADGMKRILFETINQMQDLLQYTQFREPKGDVIHKMGKSLRLYLKKKKTYPESYFKLTIDLKEDISFRSLSSKYSQIEVEKTFYEHKVFRVLGITYLHLIQSSHYDLASLCGSELQETGKVAIQLEDRPVVDAVIHHFNTFLRFGINQGHKSKEIRNVYNTLFHYSELVKVFAARRDEQRLLQCSKHFVFYANEIAGLAHAEPLFVFLIEAFSWELKKILVAVYEEGFPRPFQRTLLDLFRHVRRRKGLPPQFSSHGNERLIQIALGLYYFSRGDLEFTEFVVSGIRESLSDLPPSDGRELVLGECDLLAEQREQFWEETDQGNRNIFFSNDTRHLKEFRQHLLSRFQVTGVPQIQD